MLLVQSTHFSCQMILKICTENGSDAAVFNAKFQNDFTTEQYVLDKRFLTSFAFYILLTEISYIAKILRFTQWDECQINMFS